MELIYIELLDSSTLSLHAYVHTISSLDEVLKNGFCSDAFLSSICKKSLHFSALCLRNPLFQFITQPTGLVTGQPAPKMELE